MVHYRYHHRYEHQRVVEKVQFHSWEEQLENARGSSAAKQVGVRYRLTKKQRVFKMVPDLDRQRDIPTY